MGKSGLLEQESREIRKERYMKKTDKPFFVRDMPDHIRLSDFDLKSPVDLNEMIQISIRKGKISARDLLNR
jgi:hypothetical protein